MKSVTIELPDETFAAARRSPLEAARDMRLALAALWYEQGVVSQGMAARIANLPRGSQPQLRPLVRHSRLEASSSLAASARARVESGHCRDPGWGYARAERRPDVVC
jgi:hypothetical protein